MLVSLVSVAESERDTAQLYGIDRWGDGYFHIGSDGHLRVSPRRDPERSLDLKKLIDRLGQRGLDLPILIRFNGILEDRLQRLHECFERAVAEHAYQAQYRCVYPIKVNQQRHVVEKLIQQGRRFGFGVEAGSKPELVAVMALTDAETPIICNGFKDDDYIRLALLAQQIGRTVVPVVERASELDLILRHASRLGVRPTIGMRVKLATRGSGRWEASGGYRSKFGLTVAEILTQLSRLEELGMADCFKMLHFHVGSQITNIRQLKSAILEAARVYVDLYRRGAGLETLDVGGGLGVDYDGSTSASHSSINYSMQEYANDVVYSVQTVCDESDVPHPQLVSESGRAVAAHHSVLVVDTLGVTAQGNVQGLPQEITEDYEQPVHELWESLHSLTPPNMMESFHDAQASRDLWMNQLSGGDLPLEQRVLAENLYFAICHRVRDMAQQLDEIPDDLKHLDRMLSDIYFANFSLFQSVPDSWAIEQTFPVMPIHRLNQMPDRHAVLGDITCDSDGMIGRFTRHGKQTDTILLHEYVKGEPYQLGIFLVGAYQEILGDLHNLLGDTHAVHVDLDGEAVSIQSVVKGDTISEVLGYVQYDDRELLRQLLDSIETAVQDGKITNRQAGEAIRLYERALDGYTYLTAET
jgi:arginine decarboxylase